MKLTFLGVGSAASLKHYQSNALLSLNGKNLLIDCGGDARLSLRDVGYSYKNIDGVYISHLHQDHMGGLEWLALCTHFDPKCNKPELFISRYLKSPLWDSLKGGLSTIENEIADLDTYFNVTQVKPNKHFVWNCIKFQLVQTVHVVDGFQLMYSFGLLFEFNGKKIYITTDTQWCPNQIVAFYKQADIIIHDCEIGPFKSGVHSHFSDLSQLSQDIKSKMYLWHYPDFDLPDAIESGFIGFINQGQVIEF